MKNLIVCLLIALFTLIAVSNTCEAQGPFTWFGSRIDRVIDRVTSIGQPVQYAPATAYTYAPVRYYSYVAPPVVRTYTYTYSTPVFVRPAVTYVPRYYVPQYVQAEDTPKACTRVEQVAPPQACTRVEQAPPPRACTQVAPAPPVPVDQ